MSKFNEGQWFCEAAFNPSNNSMVVARWFGSNFSFSPKFINALGSSEPEATMPLGRWYLKDLPTKT